LLEIFAHGARMGDPQNGDGEYLTSHIETGFSVSQVPPTCDGLEKVLWSVEYLDSKGIKKVRAVIEMAKELRRDLKINDDKVPA